nr:PAS domain S-box protein [uncultured Pedobacter sp.]
METIKYFTKIFDLGPLPSLILCPNGSHFTIQTANKAYLKTISPLLSDIIGKSIFEVFPFHADPENSSYFIGFKNSLLSVMDDKTAKKIEVVKFNLTVANSNNSEDRYFEVEIIPVLSEQDEVEYILLTLIDVTGSTNLAKQLEKTVQDLKSRNDFIETIIENVPIGIAVNKINDGKATLMNKRFSEIYGWQESEFLDITSFFNKIYPDEDYRKEITARVINDIQSGDPDRMHWEGITITTSTGEKRVINAKNIPLFDQNIMISTVIDDTLAATQAADIFKVKTNQDALINCSEDQIWSIDKDLRLISFNKAYREMITMFTGNAPKEGKSVMTEEFGTELNQKWLDYYNRALNGERFTITEQIVNPLTSNIEYGLITFNPMYHESGDLFGVACYSKDITKEKLNLMALEKAQAELSRIMQSSLDMICTIDDDGNFKNVSDASIKILGYQPIELIGKPYFNLIYSEDIDKTIQASNNIKTGIETTNFQNRMMRKDGSIVPLVWSARWDKQEKTTYSIARDATETIKSELALSESEKKYRFLFENNPSPMLIWDFETLEIIDCNEEACLKYGYTKDEFLQLNTLQIRPEEDIPLIKEAVKDEATYGLIHKRIWRHTRKNGDIMIMEITGHLIKYNGRTVVINQNIDVTERIRAEKELHESEERYRLLFYNSPIPKWIYNIETYRILEVNDTAINHYGYSREEFLTMTIADIRPKEDVPMVINKLKNMFSDNQIQHFGVYNHLKKDGTVIKMEISGYQINYKGANCRMVVCIDVTEKERAFEELKQNEQTLFHSRQQLSLIYNNVKDIIFMLTVENNKKFKFSSVNQSFYSTTGIQEDSVIDKYVHDIIPEPSLSLALSKYQEAIEKKTKVTWEETTTYPTGIKTGIVTITPIFDNKGNCTQLIGSVNDITERKKDEQQLKLLESVIVHASDAVVITEAEPLHGPGPRIIYVNKAFTQMTGYTEDEVIGKSPRFLQGPNTDKRELKRLSDCMHKWQPCEITIINYKKSGEEFWLNFSITPVADANGWVTHWISIERDVTERKKTEQALQEAYNERTTILESIDDAFFAVDNNWKVTYWNKRAAALLGKSANQMLNQNIWEEFSDFIDSVSYKKYHQAIETNESVHFEDYYPPFDSWLDISCYPSKEGLAIYFKDITERKQYDIRLQELNESLLKQAKELKISNAELEQFAYVASHDLQEPLRMVTSFMAQLDKKYSDILDEKGKKYIYFAIDGAKRMRQLILDLLEFSRVGLTDDDQEEVDFNKLVKEVTALYRKKIEDLKATINFENLPTLLIYKTPIRQVFQNLISNSLKYHRQGVSPIIDISFKETATNFEFCVKDNGIGINVEFHDKIFIIFQRLHNRDEYSGTGMGLAITKKIIENIGGKIWVESVEGKGSAFYFTILKSNR